MSENISLIIGVEIAASLNMGDNFMLSSVYYMTSYKIIENEIHST